MASTDQAKISSGDGGAAAAAPPTGVNWANEFSASLVVFLVAVPLSLGIALASGAPLMAGLIAAIVGGIVIGFAGGAPLQVSGPAAGLTVIVAGLISQFGWEKTCAITVAAGVLQIGFGLLRVAPMAQAISPAVIHGMLAAIGILIAVSQTHVMLGYAAGGKGLKVFTSLPEHFTSLNPATLGIGLLTIAILVVWPHIPSAKIKRFPAALAAVGAATLVSLAFAQMPRVSLGGSLVQSLRLPTLPDGDWGAVIAAVLTLCFVASAESLLSAVATDKLHNGPRANLHRELVGQGLGNTVSGLLGGLPVTGVIVRSTANITAGAKTRFSAVMHGAWVLLFVLFLPGVITQVPLAALAGLLVYTGFKLVNPKHIRELVHHGEISVYVVTVAAIVFTNLLLGLGIGFGLALLRLLWKLTHLDIHVEAPVEGRHTSWRVFLNGTLTFARIPVLVTKLATVPAGQIVEMESNVRYMDHGGEEALESWCAGYERMGGTVKRIKIDQHQDPGVDPIVTDHTRAPLVVTRGPAVGANA